MLELKGKYNTAKVFTDNVDNETISQVIELLNQDYINDAKIRIMPDCHAELNRKYIADTVIEKMGWHICEEFQTIHNYIDTKNLILRKGSVSARDGEKLIIPINMRDGSLICVGKGNPDWNYSAPHGAGRILSRSEAKDAVGIDEFRESMKGIYSSSVMESTIDESPMVYKPMEEIMENIKDTVDIVKVIKPVYNFKAH